MEENQKPFICSVEGCMLRFTLEDHLTAHKRKHDMVLNLENGQKTNIFMADQTPTPTRFIRNCEEVGLFQDLQNVNPFEETFRKAVEATREGGSHMEVTSLHTTTTDDTLHTPHVFPNIVEEHPTLSNLISSTQEERQSQEKSATRIGREEMEPLEVSHILNQNAPAVEVNNETSAGLETIEMTNLRSAEIEVIKQEADTSQKVPPPASSSHSGGKIPVADVSVNDSVQVVIRMPDGQLVQLSGVSVGSIPSTQLPVQITPSIVSRASVTQSAVISNVQFAQNPRKGNQGSSSTAETSQARLSAAKMKLKQRIQCNSKQRTLITEPGTSSTVLCKVPLLRSHCAPSSDGSDSCVSHGKKQPNGQDDVDEQRMRFRERNRAAAMRCREKRKHWILELEKRADETQRTNQLLSAEVTKLRNELMQLKTLLLAHKNCSVTKAIQQGAKIVVGGSHSSDVQLQLKAAHSTPQDFEDFEGNICSSPEEQSHKVVLLSKPTGLKRRRQAAAALTVCGNAETNSKRDKHSHSVSQSPIIAAEPIAKISRNRQETHKVIVDKMNSSSKSCVIAVATPAIVPLVPIHLGSSSKKTSSASSTSYFVPPKVHQLSSETSSQVIKVNSNVLKSDGIDNSTTNIVNHAYGDSSMDSGHGSDIEILVEIPTKNESRS